MALAEKTYFWSNIVEYLAEMQRELREGLKDQKVDEFHFSCEENSTYSRVSLTNNAIEEFIAFDAEASNFVIGYSITRYRNERDTEIQKTEIVKSDKGNFLRRTNTNTGKTLSEISLADSPKHESQDDHLFDTLHKCIETFEGSDYQIAVQAEANRTCETQYPHLDCCLTDGTCWSVVLIINPTSWKCRLSLAFNTATVFATKNQ